MKSERCQFVNWRVTWYLIGSQGREQHILYNAWKKKIVLLYQGHKAYLGSLYVLKMCTS